ncbi:hypothetical protein MJG53_009367 [Ovis ammon polii x Ovis aries]|uniref:Uncharacterized protein n=1 Tax=Ovis ammon polii x Ovis aries TaxID=2918886 RepID=A0ACB9UWN0_9CETA|nr:hypothetical protein MJG53_009367 [Ovis ammon polii x Ovis aries]
MEWNPKDLCFFHNDEKRRVDENVKSEEKRKFLLLIQAPGKPPKLISQKAMQPRGHKAPHKCHFLVWRNSHQDPVRGEQLVEARETRANTATYHCHLSSIPNTYMAFAMSAEYSIHNQFRQNEESKSTHVQVSLDMVSNTGCDITHFKDGKMKLGHSQPNHQAQDDKSGLLCLPICTETFSSELM